MGDNTRCFARFKGEKDILKCDKEYRLRPAINSDMDLLFQWVNEEEVRKNSFIQEEISYNTHCRWFDNAIKDENIYIFILLENEEPIGQCRLNVDKMGMAELDYSIKKTRRGEGLGKLIVELMIKEISNKPYDNRIKKIVGKVKHSNISSRKCFEMNGFVEVYDVYELMV